MRYEQLLYVKEIAKTKSMRKASENLYLTQPAISDSVNRLEQELGYTIFERTKKGVQLTQTGELALPIIETILEQIKELQSVKFQTIFPKIDQQLCGEITIHATQSVLSSVLPEHIKIFTQKHPCIFFNIISCSYNTVLNDIINNRCDFGFISAPPKLLKTLSLENTYVVHTLFKTPLYIILSNDSPYAKK